MSNTMSGIRNTQHKSSHIKSPSDTTIYAPAMRLHLSPMDNSVYRMQNEQTNGRKEVVCQQIEGFNQQGFTPELTEANDSINLVTNFVENIRLQQHPTDGGKSNTAEREETDKRRSDIAASTLENVQKKAERTILEAEKFRASIEMPGMLNEVENQAVLSQKVDNASMKLLDIGRGG